MTSSHTSVVIQHLRSILSPPGEGASDGQLLERYLGNREEEALATLVRRHGPMVWGVCCRVLRNHHDAEDAFQATFLVLVRKAASIVPREMVVNWLYGVAHQTAIRARAINAKRRARERQVTEMPESVAPEANLWDDLLPLLDQELSRLPDRYRVAIVLCDLEGKSYKEAARHLGCPEGTLAARLTRGRALLAKRLARRGVVVSAAALATALAQNAASAGVPPAVVSSTIKAATLCAAGQAATTGFISAQVAALTEGVLKSMLMSKLKVVTAVVLALGIVGSGAGMIDYPTLVPVAKEARADGLPRAREQDKGQDAERIKELEEANKKLKIQIERLVKEAVDVAKQLREQQELNEVLRAQAEEQKQATEVVSRKLKKTELDNLKLRDQVEELKKALEDATRKKDKDKP
jgi:RNA polymerase sigma factor (sigma-70 family)